MWSGHSLRFVMRSGDPGVLEKLKGTTLSHRPWDERGIPASSSESRSSPDPHDPVIFENVADCRMPYAVTFSGTAIRSEDFAVATR